MRRGATERLRDLAAELVRLPVDGDGGRGSAAIRAAQHATRTIPIVMAATADPVGQGFVASLARPGGNITGLSFLERGAPRQAAGDPQGDGAPERAHRRLEQSGPSSIHGALLHNLTVAAQALGLHLHVVEVRRADELDTAFAAMTRAGADALIVMADALLIDGLRGRVADLAAKSRLPVMYDWRK